MIFSSVEEVLIDLDHSVVDLQASIKLRIAVNNGNDKKEYTNRASLSYQNNNQYLTLPFSHLNASIQRDALKALFPRDTPDASGWKHRVIYDWESLPSLVNVFVEKEHRENSLLELKSLGFSGIPSQSNIAKENNLERGVEVVIPWKWIRQDLNLKPVALKPPLEVYEGPRGERFALYKLEAGETIYSHVVLRFTYFAGQQLSLIHI